MAKGMKKILSCFIVLAILMSTMLVAAVVANDGNNSMIEDNLASALQTSTEKSSLTVNVYDINKRPLPPNNGNIAVLLLEEATAEEIGQESVDFKARATKASVTFYNIPPSDQVVYEQEYMIKVYQLPDVKDGRLEYWGAKGGIFLEEGSNTIDFVRFGQWISNIKINGKCPWTDEIVVDALEEVSIDITVKNDGLYKEKTYVELYLDQDTDLYSDFYRKSSKIPIEKGDSHTFHFDYTPQKTGIYYFYILVSMRNVIWPLIDDRITDQHEWYEGFTVTGEEVGTIYATSSPSGANVYLDGTYEGTTPRTISDVSVGSHTVKFTKSGYNDCQETVTVSADQQTDVDCTLPQIPQTGTIYATSSPSGANVYLDGTYEGTTPKTISDISVGTHTVKFTKSGYNDCQKTVTVSADQQMDVFCTLPQIPQTGTIYATSSPSGANVYLDGTYEGTTPKTISDISVGTHTVKFTKSGYNDCQETVTVSADQQTDVDCTLPQIPQTGTIYATSSPSGANVYLDGTYEGTTPKTISDISVGTHTVKFTKSGYNDCQKTVTVSADQQMDVFCTLETSTSKHDFDHDGDGIVEDDIDDLIMATDAYLGFNTGSEYDADGDGIVEDDIDDLIMATDAYLGFSTCEGEGR